MSHQQFRVALEEAGPCSVCGLTTHLAVLSRITSRQHLMCASCWSPIAVLEEIPRCGPFPRFAVGELVYVARVFPPTSVELIGFRGTVSEVEALDGPQYNYDVDGRYLNEQMLERVPQLRKPRPLGRRLG